MNAVKLLNLAPMMIMVAFLAYSGYSIHASRGRSGRGPVSPGEGPGRRGARHRHGR